MIMMMSLVKFSIPPKMHEGQSLPQNRFWRKNGEFSLSVWGTGELPCGMTGHLKEKSVEDENRAKT